MLNKDYLFGAPMPAPVVVSGESERDRRLRLRAEERLRKFTGENASAYENKEDQSKRDVIWEMKKMQRLGGNAEATENNPIKFQSEGYRADYGRPQEKYPSFDYVKENQEVFGYPGEQKIVRPSEAYSAEYLNNASLQGYKPEPVKNVTKEQGDYADNLFNNLLKGPDPGFDKKKQYAEDLKRQIEEKNRGKMVEANEIGLNFPSRNRNDDKANYTAELDAQVRAKRPSQGEDFYSNPVLSQQISEKEKKMKYARELEAQIQHKRQEPKPNWEKEEVSPFLSEQNLARDKKMQYAQELQAQIRDKNSRNSNTYEPIPRPAYENNRGEGFHDYFSKASDYKPVEEPYRNKERMLSYPQNAEYEPVLRKQISEDPYMPSSLSAAEEKKLKYRQQLEQQIEEQKRQKEEQKKKIKMDEERAEKRFFNDAGIDPAKPIVMKKTVDPNKPSEENPQAERYKLHLQKMKGNRTDLLTDLPEERFSQNPVSTKAERFYSEPPAFEPSPMAPVQNFNMERGKLEQNEINYNRPNEFLIGQYADPRGKMLNQEHSLENMRKVENPHSSVIETYLREIQETRLERDMAREKCLEMRELMLKEKERNLENMLSLARGAPYESRPPSYQEQRNPVYSGYRQPEPIENNYADYSRNIYPEQVVTPSLYQNPMIQNNWKRPESNTNIYAKDLLDVSPLVPPVPEPNHTDLFERSLAGNSKWVDVNQSKWGNVKIIDSMQVPPDDFKERKRWGIDLPLEKASESLIQDNTPRFQRSIIPKNIYVDDESLPSKIEHVPFYTSKADLASSHEKSIDEEIEYGSDQAYSDNAESVKESEMTREITMSNPKYEAVEENLIESEEWSESHSEAEAEIKNRSTKGSYNKPQIIDVFREKPANRGEPSPKKEIKEMIEVKETKEIMKPVPAQGRIAFSRLEEARKHAKQLKVKDPEGIETSGNLEVLPNKSSQSSFEGRFTKLALNELRQQKVKNPLEDSGKGLDKLKYSNSNKKLEESHENQVEPKQSILKSLSGMRAQSRRYED